MTLGSALTCGVLASLSNWQHGVTMGFVWLFRPRTCWGGQNWAVAPPETQTHCPRGSQGVSVLHWMPTISAKGSSEQHPALQPISTRKRSTAQQGGSWVLVAHVNKHHHAIITSVNKHDPWVSQDTAPVHSKQVVGEENVGCADSESWYSHFPAPSSMEAHPPVHMEIPPKAPCSLLGGLRCPFANTNSV